MEDEGHYRFIFFVSHRYCQVNDTLMNKFFLSRRNSMRSLNMIAFYKSACCPASQDLLAFEKGEVFKNESDEINRHLESCEFCTAEIEFYAHFPQCEEIVASAEIPPPLYQLAEALLTNRHKEYSLLNKLLNENENLAIEKV